MAEKRTLQERLIGKDLNYQKKLNDCLEQISILEERLSVMTSEKNGLQVRLNAFERNQPLQDDLN